MDVVVQGKPPAFFAELFIAREEIEPTPALATLYTDNPVNQTTELTWVNYKTIKLLADRIETLNLLSISASSTTDDVTGVGPSPTETVPALTTITGELEVLRSRLMSSATMLLPTPVQIHGDEYEPESEGDWLETDVEVPDIRPGPGECFIKDDKASKNCSVKQVPTVPDSTTGETTSENAEPVPPDLQATPTETPRENSAEGASAPKRIKYDGMNITGLPDEPLGKILSCLTLADLNSCRCVCRHWQELIDSLHMRARLFYRSRHPMESPPGLQETVGHYESSVRQWLTAFSDDGRTAVEELDSLKKHKYFPEILFFSMARVLTEAEGFVFQTAGTVRHDACIQQASFNPGGNHLVTISEQGVAKVWGLIDGQWQEQLSIPTVRKACFSPEGNYLMALSLGETSTVWKLVDKKWEKARNLQHSPGINSGQFSPNGSYFVAFSRIGFARIWALIDGQWQEINFRQSFSQIIKSARFSPDGNHLVVIFIDGSARRLGAC